MKVGIITYHRANNYGALLQCYALQEILRELGCEVCVIDYWQPFIEKLYRPSKISQIKAIGLHPKALLNLIRKFKEQDVINQRYDSFRAKYLSLSEKCTFDTIPKLDLYIVGSDQMWSVNCVGNKIDNVYFGEFDRPADSRLIGFSISSNRQSLNFLGQRLNKSISNFDSLSFRENEIANWINLTLSKDFSVTLDPTLCADASLWNNITGRSWASKKYLVLYHVKYRFAPIVHELLLKQAKRIAKSMGLELVDLSSASYEVSDFVSAIRYAQCVITSSFHATVFSIIFSRPLFAVQLHDGGDGRYVNLLHTLDMGSSIVDLDFTETFPASIDYGVVHDKLSQLRVPSIEYLKTNIQVC